jgi:hypothetical protein
MRKELLHRWCIFQAEGNEQQALGLQLRDWVHAVFLPLERALQHERSGCVAH